MGTGGVAVQHDPAVGLPSPVALRRSNVAAGLILLALCYVAFFYAIGAHDLWGPDEVRYALVAREMAESGDYVVPHLNGEIYTEKPPLVFWLTNLFVRAGGLPYESAARLPSACASIVTVFCVWLFASRRWDRTTGFVAAAMLTTNPQVYWFGRSGMLDSVLMLWVTLATIACVRGLECGRNWWRWFAGAGGAMAAALLTKGPVGVLVPVLVTLGCAVAGRRWRRAVGGIVVSVGVAVVLVLPWLLAAVVRSTGAYGGPAELWGQTYGRAVEGYSHHRPFYYYAEKLVPFWLPWGLLLPGALWAAWRARGTGAWATWRLQVIWAGLPFLAFSAFAGKREGYILPLYPAIAMLLAVYVSRLASKARPLSAFRYPWVCAVVMVVMLALSGVTVMSLPLWLAARVAVVADVPRFSLICTSAGAVFLALSAAGAYVTSRSRPSDAFGFTVAAMALMFVASAGVVLPLGDRVKAARSFAEELRQLKTPDRQLVLFDSFRADIGFYLHERLEVVWPPGAMHEVLARDPSILGIVQEKHMREIDTTGLDLEVVRSSEIGSKTWLVVQTRTGEGR